MKDLFMKLPPFSPDYCGVASALFELGGIVAFHDGTGCTGNYVCHDEPRGYGSQSAIFTSNLREMEVVFGDDEIFLGKVVQADRDLNAPFIAMLSSPVPMVIGTDFKALGRIVSRRTGKPTLTFDTGGIQFYDVGMKDAWMALAKQFAAEVSAVNPRHINILGATPLDFGAPCKMAALKQMLKECGAEKITSWGMDGGLDDIRYVGEAGVNLVVQVSALPVAKYLKERFGTPYIVGLPIGRRGECILANQLGTLWGEPERMDNSRCYAKLLFKKALVIHEQVTANAWRTCLQEDFGVAEVDVASYFTLDTDLLQENDVHLREEDELQKLIDTRGYDLVLGDKLFQAAVESDVAWIPVPHLAVSGCIHWDKDFCDIGETAYAYMNNRITKMC